MSDTFIRDCKYCGTHTDCIEGVCMNCAEAKDWLLDNDIYTKDISKDTTENEVIALLSLYANR